MYHTPPSTWIRSFLKSKVQPPPPEGSVGLSEKSKVQPPLGEGPRDPPNAIYRLIFTEGFHAFGGSIWKVQSLTPPSKRVGWTSQKV